MTLVSVLTIKATKEAVSVHIKSPFLFNLTKQANKKTKAKKPHGSHSWPPTAGVIKKKYSNDP